MDKKRNYNFVVDLSGIPKKNSYYDWKNSVGCRVPFTSDIFNGVLTIKDYISVRKGKSKNTHLVIYYNNKNLGKITVECLKSGSLGGILKKYLPFWKYNIGDLIKDDKRSLEITDRRYIDHKKKYKIKCNKCGFDSGKYRHVSTNKPVDEYWVAESNLENGRGCPCCSFPIKAVVVGKNDINTTDQWMVKYLKNKNDAFLYTSGSSKKVDMICPDCGTIKKDVAISQLKKIKYLSCVCSDNISMPNKIAYYTLKDIPDLDNYIREFMKDWTIPYRYDNYFEYNNKKFIIEMDGNVGHGNMQFKSNKKDEDGIKRDKIKDELAKKNGIILYRIDCTSNNYHDIFIRLKDTLFKILDKEINVDENTVMLFASKNIIKEVCNYYKNICQIQTEIAKSFHISIGTVEKYLAHGNKYGWCDYIKLQEQRIVNKKIAIDLYNKNNLLGTKGIAEKTGYSRETVTKYLKEANSENLCSYDARKEMELGRKNGLSKAQKRTSKKVYVYNSKLQFLKSYPSVNELERSSTSDFGIEFKSRCVSRVCLGERTKYKNHIFSYTPLHNMEEINESKES